ncbi:MAG TPA: GNAT family N-acetyltransferase [Acidobacteriaceae bacterium]|nr:GNAT family N-acetyltransferase [Acidobacteriaceae bacterium]
MRSATADDAPGIARVHVDTWRSSYQGIIPQDFLDALDAAKRAAMWKAEIGRKDAHVLVAEDTVAEDTVAVCGFISGGILRDGVDVARQNYDSEIYTLYVSPAFQGHGVGRELMRALAARLAEDGLTRPVVWALEKNPWCAFYERLGGRRVAQKTIEIGALLRR